MKWNFNTGFFYFFHDQKSNIRKIRQKQQNYFVKISCSAKFLICRYAASLTYKEMKEDKVYRTWGDSVSMISPVCGTTTNGPGGRVSRYTTGSPSASSAVTCPTAVKRRVASGAVKVYIFCLNTGTLSFSFFTNRLTRVEADSKEIRSFRHLEKCQ